MARMWFAFKCAIFLVGLPAESESSHGRPCQPRAFTESVVCVCDSNYCDDVIRIPPDSGSFVAYTSSKSGLRFDVTKGSLNQTSCSSSGISSLSLNKVIKLVEPAIQLDQSTTYQTIEGFGGAVTDAAAINWMNLKIPSLKQNLINERGQGTVDQFIQESALGNVGIPRGLGLNWATHWILAAAEFNSYFGKNGLEYNMIRTPIGGSDFSTREYAYNEYPKNDTLLSNFTLAPEDFNYKIPMIKAAMAAATDDIHILAAVWSPPPWMKNTHEYSGLSLLMQEYFQTYAEYHLKYIEAYAAQNISIWAITTGNEPITSTLAAKFNSLGWQYEQLGKWIAQNLGPTIHKSRYDVKILACDDQRPYIPVLLNMVVKAHPEAERYISGIAVHWYADETTPSSILDETSKRYPEKFIIGTEACTGSEAMEVKVALGSWIRAVRYATDIIQDLSNNVVGWIDWNLDLDMVGGPNWSGNFVDASIIVFAEDQEFVKQPMYYAMGHFSKFIPRGSIRINATNHALLGITHVAFQTPQDTVVIVLYNDGLAQTVKFKLEDQEASVMLAADSIVTVEIKS